MHTLRTMVKVLRSSALLASAGVLFALASSAAAADNTPNVVFILADNVGYGDMGPYGGGQLRGMPV